MIKILDPELNQQRAVHTEEEEREEKELVFQVLAVFPLDRYFILFPN